LKCNRQITAPKVRVIDSDGGQLGVLNTEDAMRRAEEKGLDLVEIVEKSQPPVCKIIDYGKYRYDQTKREKEHKKSQHQIKVKEIKMKPNIDIHDFDFKVKRSKEFIEKGNKVKVTCTFRGRELAHPEIGMALVKKVREQLKEVSMVESDPKMIGRSIIMVLMPIPKKSK
jgi:translation initiation factor IF-3